MTEHSPEPGRKRRWTAADLGSREWSVFAALVLLLIGCSALYLARDYRAHWRDSERRLASTSDVIVEFVRQVNSIVDLTLRSVDDDRLSANIVVSRSPRELHQILRAAQSASPMLQGLGLTDDAGKVITSFASPEASGVDLSDRDFFQAHRDDPHLGLHIGRPVFARPQNVIALPVSRRLQTPGGAFAGVIAARVDPRYFSGFFGSTGADVVTIYRPDGLPIARYPEIDLVAAGILPPPNPVVERAAKERRGVLLHDSPVNRIERLTSFHTIDSPALIVTVSLDASGIRKAWLARTYPFFVLLAGGLVFLSVIAFLVQRHQRATARALAETAEARATAEQLADVKGTFLANMSHEIRTPLGGILGYADLLLKSGLGAQQADWTVKLKSAGEQLLAVINDILDYSKLEAGDFAIDPQPVALAVVVDEVASLMTPQAAARGLQLTCELEPGLPKWIRADPVRLRQILFNLVSNALKFTDRGSISISVARTRLPGPKAAIEVEVSDTGIGIPEEKLATVFQRFTQAETKASKGRGGTGLGLSISRRLAELMGGTLTLDSKVGAGTTVRLAVPLVAAMAPAEATGAAPVVARTGHILLVEDLPMNIEIIAAMLRAQGHHVTAVTRGIDAIDVAIAEDFDAILLDINLPDIDGYEVAREIRKLERPGRRTPILALTANALPENIRQALDAGMDGHIAKPANESVLASQLAAVMSPSAASTRGPAAETQAPLIDMSTSAALRKLVGEPRFADLKDGFWEKWRAFRAELDVEHPDTALLAARTHDMVSFAGNVGYLRLAQACRQASHLSGEGAADLRPAIGRMLAVADDTAREDRRG